MRLSDIIEYDELHAETKYRVLIIYDISDNRARNKMAKFLKGFGYRVQRSAFECVLNVTEYRLLTQKIEKYINKKDLVRIYRCPDWLDIKVWGTEPLVDDEDFLIL